MVALPWFACKSSCLSLHDYPSYTCLIAWPLYLRFYYQPLIFPTFASCNNKKSFYTCTLPYCDQIHYCYHPIVREPMGKSVFSVYTIHIITWFTHLNCTQLICETLPWERISLRFYRFVWDFSFSDRWFKSHVGVHLLQSLSLLVVLFQEEATFLKIMH